MKKRGTNAKHRVKDTEVFAAHQRDKPAYYMSEPGHRALVYMLGETQEKRLILVALVPSKRSGIWEAVTAYEANAHHRDRYSRS